MQTNATEAVPERIGRYRVLEKLGEGGMGVVYVALDEDLDRKIALKVLRSDTGGEAKRLQREARAMAKLSHPNVVTVYEVSVIAGSVCVAMELVVGKTLREWLESTRSLGEIGTVFAQAARGLMAAHEAGITHRDFKPDNVLVGDDGRVRVLDFGLAKTTDELGLEQAEPFDPERPPETPADLDLERLTVTGALMGTPRYMAPEQFEARRADARTDQFSFCVALFEAVHGQRPFPGTDLPSIALAVMLGRVRSPPAGSAVPRSLDAAIMRGLSTDPDERHESLEPLVALLDRTGGAKRRWWPWVVGGIVVFVGGAGAFSIWLAREAAEVKGEQVRAALEPDGPDPDGDGLEGEADLCPMAPEDLDKFMDGDGCPDPDNDGDEVLDVDDACPLEWGSHDGCPAPAFAWDKCKLRLPEKVYFEFNAAGIKSQSLDMLDDVAKTLRESQAGTVQVQVHTDNVGDAQYNIDLSSARAKEIVKYLEKAESGVDLEPAGIGPGIPIASNDTPEGRTKNRRVEFVRLDCGQEPDLKDPFGGFNPPKGKSEALTQARVAARAETLDPNPGPGCTVEALYYRSDGSLSPEEQRVFDYDVACLAARKDRCTMNVGTARSGDEAADIASTDEIGNAMQAAFAAQGIPGDRLVVISKGSLEARRSGPESVRDRVITFVCPAPN